MPGFDGKPCQEKIIIFLDFAGLITGLFYLIGVMADEYKKYPADR